MAALAGDDAKPSYAWAGRRNAEAAYFSAHTASADEPIIALIWYCEVIVGFADKSTRWYLATDLGLSRNQVIPLGDEATHPILRALSIR